MPKAGYIAEASDRLLVTGASGFIGAKVIEMLFEYGFTNIRCFVRPSSNLDRLKAALERSGRTDNVDWVTGDLLSPNDCCKAVDDVSIVFHLAAGIEKSFAGAFMNSALATRNLLDASLATGRLKRFVNVSSFAVYSNLKLKRGALLDENCALEDSPQDRFDPYGFGKLKQDHLVMDYGASRRLPYVIVRPGTVFGPGKRALSGRIGIDTFGIFLHLGGSNLIPLTYVENCAEAILLAGLTPGIDGEIFNVVDDNLLTSRQFLKAYKRQMGGFRSLYIPYRMAQILCRLWEGYSKWSRGQLPPVFNRRRCSAEWKGNRYSNQKLQQKTGWTPRVSMEQAMRSFLEQFNTNTK